MAKARKAKGNAKQIVHNLHLPPVPRFDPKGKADRISALLEKARREPVTAEEYQILAEALRNHQPWLEWTGKPCRLPLVSLQDPGHLGIPDPSPPPVACHSLRSWG